MRYWFAPVLLPCLLCSACSMTVVPPAEVKDPVAVHVVDYGRHASVVLPAGDGKLAEFSWGEWVFYAKARTGPYETAQAMFFSPGATLSRRYIDVPVEYRFIVLQLGAQRVTSFNVERERAAALLGELTARYHARVGTEIYNEEYETYFVRDDLRHYWGLYNCTHEAARWLRQLGCRVKGYSLAAEFVLPEGYHGPNVPPRTRPATGPVMR